MAKISSELFLTAKELTRFVRTDWSMYDFSEKSSVLESRVPQIVFDELDVNVVLNEVQKNEGVRESYVRECQVEYSGYTFVYKLTAVLNEKNLFNFRLEVFTPAGDGKGGLVKLFSEKI